MFINLKHTFCFWTMHVHVKLNPYQNLEYSISSDLFFPLHIGFVCYRILQFGVVQCVFFRGRLAFFFFSGEDFKTPKYPGCAQSTDIRLFGMSLGISVFFNFPGDYSLRPSLKHPPNHFHTSALHYCKSCLPAMPPW